MSFWLVPMPISECLRREAVEPTLNSSPQTARKMAAVRIADRCKLSGTKDTQRTLDGRGNGENSQQPPMNGTQNGVSKGS